MCAAWRGEEDLAGVSVARLDEECLMEVLGPVEVVASALGNLVAVVRHCLVPIAHCPRLLRPTHLWEQQVKRGANHDLGRARICRSLVLAESSLAVLFGLVYHALHLLELSLHALVNRQSQGFLRRKIQICMISFQLISGGPA